ncbi:hypothetical protein AB0L14_18545 [Streptomyces sp. NPDC052727]|uniref:hypothetical protein n=1 Tax=Streptomyces sp. NPDC052727 TaxID=3154854 RepID=UPI00342AE9FD
MTDAVLTPTAAGRLFSRPAAVASCVGFVLIGMLQALYGPAVPGLRAEYGLSPSGAGLGLSLHFTGGVAGVLAFNAVHARISNRTLVTAALAQPGAAGRSAGRGVGDRRLDGRRGGGAALAGRRHRGVRDPGRALAADRAVGRVAAGDAGTDPGDREGRPVRRLFTRRFSQPPSKPGLLA